ncbi:MAG: prephenate dehydratase [Alphaproteobacteria bacterium]|nr:prephenate dehydratase [Alphaproteobacteria bacterium]
MINKTKDALNTIAFQGSLGAYSHISCLSAFPDMEVLPCHSFEDVFVAVEKGKARLAMLPIENSVAGRVADIHILLPKYRLYAVGEHFQRIEHNLLAPKGATLETIKTVRSHVQALSQCSDVIRNLRIEPLSFADTARAAEKIAKDDDITKAAIASKLAGEIYGLTSLKENIENSENNTTRFLVMSKEKTIPSIGSCPVVTSMIFRVKNIPAALYKVLGGFATNGINLTKLESYIVGGDFVAAQFYADAEGHPEERSLQLALEELGFFSHEVTILGTYPAHQYRLERRIEKL